MPTITLEIHRSEILKPTCTVPMASNFSEEAEEKAELRAKLEEEREQRGLKLRDTEIRVKKYDRLKKKNVVRVSHDWVKHRQHKLRPINFYT